MPLHQIRLINSEYHYIARLIEERANQVVLEKRHRVYTPQAKATQKRLREEAEMLERLLRDTFISI